MNDDYSSTGEEPSGGERADRDSIGNGGPDELESTGNGGPDEEEIAGIQVTHTEIYDTSTGEGAVIDEFDIILDDKPTENARRGPGGRETQYGSMPTLVCSVGNGGPDEDGE